MDEPFIVIDRTHLGRRASGIERITRDLFSDEALLPLRVRGTRLGAGRFTTLFRQLVCNPLEALLQPNSIWVFSGFPPSPVFGRLAHRSILYVHDLFLIERPDELNRAARLYMAPNFRAALRSFRWFLANSVSTAAQLRNHIDPAAKIQLYRPMARDVLGVGSIATEVMQPVLRPIRIGMIGTIEPRKNYKAAVAILQALESRLAQPVELHIVGRTGWGPDADMLAKTPHVYLHGFIDDNAIVELVRSWTLFLCTSHDEGLGLPLLEIQHAGLPVVAPDKCVFLEVLGRSGTYVDPSCPRVAADAIVALLDGAGPESFKNAARLNLQRWNFLADDDHKEVIGLLSARLASLSRVLQS